MIENCLKLYKDLSKTPSLKDVKFIVRDKSKSSTNSSISTEYKIEGTWSIPNLDFNEWNILQANYLLLSNHEVQHFPSAIQDKRVVLTSVAPSGKYTASLFQDEDICCLTITSEDNQTSSINLKDQEIHGKVYSDVELSSFCWSPDSSLLAYVAEKKKPKPYTYFDKQSEKSNDGRGQKFSYVDDWGEQMTDQHQSSIIIVNVKDHQLRVLNIPEKLCGGQVVWTPDGNAVVGVAFITDPFRLGLIYCRNRESVLFKLDLEDHFEEFTPRGMHVHSPRFSNDGSKLVYIQSPMGGPHVRCAQLCLINWHNKQSSVLIDYVARPFKLAGGSLFSGLCGTSILPLCCWTEDSRKLVFSSVQYFGYSSYILDIETKEIFCVPLSGNVIAYDVKQDQLLLSKSTCTEPCILIQTEISDNPKETADWNMIQISPTITINDIPCDWQDTWTFINPIPHPKNQLFDLPIPIIYFGPTKALEDGKKRPLIVWVHGGPHSAYSNTFSVSTAFFVKLGYSIIFPNYKGSLGQGQDSLESLPGNCGQADVNDVYEATKETLRRFKDILDPSKIALIGGSHGGFLVTHLAAQYPDMFKVVSSRNPVIDIASMTVVTDIPDWNFVEAGESYEIGQNCNGEMLSKMFKMSPIHIIDKVKAPTLLLLGKNDRRVPFSQGLLYHKLLLANKIPTKAFIYQDCHPLSKVDSEADSVLQTAVWFNEHLNL